MKEVIVTTGPTKPNRVCKFLAGELVKATHDGESDHIILVTGPAATPDCFKGVILSTNTKGYSVGHHGAGWVSKYFDYYIGTVKLEQTGKDKPPIDTEELTQKLIRIMNRRSFF